MANISDFLQTLSWNPSIMSNWTAIGFAGFTLIMLWSIIWKGIALWKAGRLGQKAWFVILLVVNTFGILEIIYIFAVARKKERTGTPM